MSGHHHLDPSAGDARVVWAVVANLGLTVAQIIGGILSGSLALIADAIHNLSDALALVIAFMALKIARQPANEKMTFGYGRAEIVAALINYTTLIVIGLYLVYEAVLRFFNPEDVDGWLVVIIAVIALAVDLVTALLTYSLSKQSVNIRAAFLHNVADALGSIAVIIAGSLILLYDWRLVDPLVTLMIAGYILWQSFSEIVFVIHILMLGSPTNFNTKDVFDRMLSIKGVADVHNLHLWKMQEHENALDAHVVIDTGQWKNADEIKKEVKSMLSSSFKIRQTTLEVECSFHACEEPKAIGHNTIVRDNHYDHSH
ncbi:cation diffusion facilitator family transporter [Neptuniibacter pectenicola]|jgi:cobalt-zinc-cadmium efflux system protein|uniref:Cation diffusion facilitator family transporter n=1 Tax=Neptuniibacter pectenicola TaxID=1806669 RepID=A0ABU9TW94_9GAMM